MQAVHTAAGAIAMGAGEAFVCAGVESMSRVPMGGFNPMPHPGLAERYPQIYISHGRDGRERGGAATGIARERQEAFAVESQRKAADAQRAGRLADEIVPIASNGAPSTPTAACGPTRPPRCCRASSRRSRGRHRHGRHVVAAHRRRRGVLVTLRGLRRATRAEPLAAVRRIAVAGLRARDHGHRAGAARPARRWPGRGLDDRATSTWSS